MSSAGVILPEGPRSGLGIYSLQWEIYGEGGSSLVVNTGSTTVHATTATNAEFDTEDSATVAFCAAACDLIELLESLAAGGHAASAHVVAHATSKGGRDPVIALPGIFEPGTESAERVSCRTMTVVNSVTQNHGIQRALLVDLLPWAMDRGFQPKEFVAVLRDYPEVRRKVRSALFLKLRALGARASDPALVHGANGAVAFSSELLGQLSRVQQTACHPSFLLRKFVAPSPLAKFDTNHKWMREQLGLPLPGGSSDTPMGDVHGARARQIQERVHELRKVLLLCIEGKQDCRRAIRAAYSRALGPLEIDAALAMLVPSVAALARKRGCADLLGHDAKFTPRSPLHAMLPVAAFVKGDSGIDVSIGMFACKVRSTPTLSLCIISLIPHSFSLHYFSHCSFSLHYSSYFSSSCTPASSRTSKIPEATARTPWSGRS